MLGQLRIFERSHLSKVSFELHLPWRVGVTPFSYKTGCTSQSCQNSLIPWNSLTSICGGQKLCFECHSYTKKLDQQDYSSMGVKPASILIMQGCCGH